MTTVLCYGLGGRLVIFTHIRREDGVHTGHTTNFKTHLWYDDELVIKKLVQDGSITQVL